MGDTIESKTKGIWAWCRVHPERKNEVLLLLDTEGLGDVDKVCQVKGMICILNVLPSITNVKMKELTFQFNKYSFILCDIK